MRRRNRRLGQYESLEPKRLLAGDVTVFDDPESGTVFIRGDAEANEIEIRSTPNVAEVVIRGLNGTLVNGQEEVSIDATRNTGVNRFQNTIGGLGLNLGPGDDSLFVRDLIVENRLVAYGGPGDDDYGFYNVISNDDFIVQTFTGNDNISLDTSQSQDRLVVFPLEGDNTVGFDNVFVRNQTLIRAQSGSDTIAIDESNHAGPVFAFTGSGDDVIVARDTRLGSAVGIQTLAGNDQLLLDGVEATSGRGVFVSGGGGTDILEAVDTQLSFSTTTRSFEATDGGDFSQVDAAFDEFIVSGIRLGTIAELARLTPDLSTLSGALVATGLDTAVDGDGPLTVFAPLNSAFDRISDTVASLTTEQLSDVLLYHAVGARLGSAFVEPGVTITTLLGQTISVDSVDDGGVVLNESVGIAAVDIEAKNGVVHLLTDVLIPNLG